MVPSYFLDKKICSKNGLGLNLLIIKYNHKCEKVLCDSYLDNEYCLKNIRKHLKQGTQLG